MTWILVFVNLKQSGHREMRLQFNNHNRSKLKCLILWLACLIFAPTLYANTITKLTIDHAIGPASAEYLAKGLAHAKSLQAEAVLIQLDTPGGLELAMRDMMQMIAGSSIPVMTYVSPTGARAASAGLFILYASPVSAMAPGTNVGAATPVTMGDQEESANTQAMQKKAMNDAVASIQSFAELYGRNAEWAEQAIREGVSLSSEEAHKRNVVDYLAKNDQDLLAQVDGSLVKANHEMHLMQTKNARIAPYDPDWRTQLLLTISDPSIAYLLLMAGVTALFLEFAYAGTGIPGVLGAVSILLAFYGLQMLPVNYTGLMLIVLGFVLIVLEAVMASMGLFAILGVLALFFGSIMLIDTDAEAFQIVQPVLYSVLFVSGLLAWVLASMAIRSHRRSVVSGVDVMLNHESEVQADHHGRHFILIHGERWLIKDPDIHAGDQVKVVGFDGVYVNVVKK